MLEALMWGLISTSSLVLGGLIGCTVKIGNRTLGLIMAFGAGVLISAVSYELVFEALSLGKGTGAPTLGIAVGALVFFFGDQLISGMGAEKRGAIGQTPGGAQAALVVPMLLGIILDGVPESLCIGLGILEDGTVSMAMLVAVFISNLPEAIAGTSGMKASGWSTGKILGLWIAIAVFCSFATVAGFALFDGLPEFWLSFVQGFAAGAILTMLANSMMPEAFEHGGKLAGLLTVLGFCTSVAVVLMERAQG